ncbi:MAG: alpha/beta fold hydrolase [Pseudomonadota bacterium]
MGSSSVQSASDKKEIEFPTRKAKALFIYLAMSPNLRTSREKLAGLFWGRSAEEQARASLRQTLASLRKILNFNDQCLIESNSDEIYLVEDSLYVDALAFEQQTDDEVSSAKHAVDLYQGEFLDGFSIKEDLFENWLREKREHINELAKLKMASLADYWNGSGELNKAISISKNILSIDPLNEQAHQSLMHLYTLTGWRESAIKQYKHYEKLLKEELGVDPQEETTELYQKILAKTPLLKDEPKVLSATPKLQDVHIQKNNVKQEIRYCVSEDGARIAYAVAGDGTPVIKCGNWLTHLEHDWDTPIWRHLMQFLANDYSLVRYDARGNGLSDWDVDEINFDSFISDLETVANASGHKKFILFGTSQGCAISAAYAARHPERVSHLILYGGFAAGWNKRNNEYKDRGKAFLTLIQQGWGQDNPIFRQMFTSLFLPDGAHEQVNWFNDLQKKSTTPENAMRFYQALGEINVTKELSNITVPTLVMHCKDDAMVPFIAGQDFAKRIPHAKFVALEGRNHLMLKQEPAFEQFKNEFRAFINV